AFMDGALKGAKQEIFPKPANLGDDTKGDAPPEVVPSPSPQLTDPTDPGLSDPSDPLDPGNGDQPGGLLGGPPRNTDPSSPRRQQIPSAPPDA
ncbi:MAG TPA: hypothetical protein VHU91_09570, partial [Mycobacteriales bacterium]|nr:hypothetical protein [Mycobacteriales bacterium]